MAKDRRPEKHGRRSSRRGASPASSELRASAAAAISKREAEFRRAFDQAAIGMALVALDGGWLRVNPVLCQIVGYSESELLATDFQSITHPEDLSADLAFVGQMLRGEIRSYQMEKRYLHRAQHIVWVLLSVSLVYGRGGKPLFFFAQIQDISESKRMEAALRESDKKFQALLDNSPNMIFLKDVDGRYLLVNRKFEQALGVRQENIKGRQDEEVFSREQALAFRANDLQVLKMGVPIEFEEVAQQADGLHTSIVHKFPLFDTAGNIYAIGGIVTDISERKRAEEDLRHREEEHRRLIENVPEVVWKADECGKVFFISEEIEKVFGYSVTDIYQQGERLWFGRMHPEDRDRVQEAYSKLFHENRPFDVEYRIQHKEGRWMWWHDRAGLVTGNLEQRVAEGLLSDVTQRKEIEQQVRQRLKMEAIGRLAGGVAHDFNNLLMVIQGNAELLTKVVAPNEPRRRNLDQIEKAADRAASLTRQLLAFSRMQVLEPTVLDLNAIMAEMAKMLPRLISENVELVFAADSRLGHVKADAGQMEQVILNLAVNARDAMPQGGKLVIETRNFIMDEVAAGGHEPAKAGQYVLLSVSDTGHGMDAETRSHIFEPFFTTKSQGKGTGLGLATVYGIVKQSGGFIWVYSEPGQGTTFKIYLPRVDEPLESIAVSQQDPASIAGTETLLLVEDEEPARELMVAFLKKNGYTVLEAKNGLDALRVAEQHGGTIHLLVTDMVMPKMGGRELADRLAMQRPGLKPLYLSGYSERIAAPDTNRGWRGAFLQKPFAMDVFGRKVREILNDFRKPERDVELHNGGS
ncbi:MAG TPA: PAS domain S-box protein [Terriglobales bacterium]|nr:PAS domain S-box protein [Terriglobales bacterium]